jgi:hypothetical protein
MRILLAPVTVSPTKPLTPSHLRVLLSMDMVHRATGTYADVTHVYRPLAHAASRQVVAFWEYLDRRHPGTNFDGLSEEEIGALYTGARLDDPVSYAALEPYIRRAATGWTHPASARLLDLWEEHYRVLGMRDPALGRDGPELMPLDDLIPLLEKANLCIDGRTYRAPVYLDATPAGLPLRVLVGADGHANYLASTLAELVPLLPDHDHVVLVHDPEIRADYRTIAYVLTTLGARVSRLEFPRVPLDGVARSARYGGWEGYTVGAMADGYDAPAFGFGYRLYLLAGLGRSATESFSVKHLRRWVHRAGRLLDEHRAGKPEPVSLATFATAKPYADPYRLATALLSKECPVPRRDLLDVLVGPC